MSSNRGRVEGAAAWAAYGALEVAFAIGARRLLFAATFVPPHPAYPLLLLVLYPLAGALLGRFAIPGLAVLVAVNAIAAMNGPMVLLAIGIAVMIVVLRLPRWPAAALLIIPLWIARDVAHQQSFWIKAAAAGCAVIVIGGVALRLRKQLRPERVSFAFATFAVATLGSLFLDTPAPRNLPPDTAPPRTSQPNVLLVVMDTVRADHLSAYGYARDTTPHLTRFARNATLYRRAYSPSNMTLASTASLFTGQYGTEHTAHFDEGWLLGRPLPPSALTAAELLSARGYATASITANYIYLGRTFGLDQGFQHLDARPPALPFGAASDFTLRRGLSSLAERALPARLRPSSRPATEITKLARSYLARVAGKRRPFFLVVNYMDAHEPCIPPPPYDTRFPGHDPSQSGHLADRLIGTMNRGEPLKITPRESAHLLSQYDGGIAYQDAQIATLIDDLRARNAYDNTLIVILSDHGESFGEHGVISHGTNNYEHEVRVPFIVKKPMQTTGSTIDAPVSTLEAWAMMTGTAAPPFPVITESFPMRGRGLAQKHRRPGRAKIEGTLKTIVNLREPIEMYDLAADPAESRNLGSNATSARMAAEITAWLASLEKQKALPSQQLDPEMIRRLRALGYIQ